MFGTPRGEGVEQIVTGTSRAAPDANRRDGGFYLARSRHPLVLCGLTIGTSAFPARMPFLRDE